LFNILLTFIIILFTILLLNVNLRINIFIFLEYMKKYKLNKGILIALEGVDGAGKTTQTIRLRDHFRRLGFEVEIFKEPTDGKYGQEIRNLAINGRHTVTPEYELELFIKDRIEDCEKNLGPALLQKKLIFIDRYYFSSIAYQGALGLNTDYILKRNKEVAIMPELVIILDVAVKIGLSRIKNFRKEEYNHFEREDYLEKVRSIFLKMKDTYIQIIDGSREEDEVFSNIKNITQDIISPYAYTQDNQYNLFAKNIQMGKLTFSSN